MPSFTDSFTGTNGNPWDPALWTAGVVTGVGASTIDTNRGKQVTSAVGGYTDFTVQIFTVGGQFKNGTVTGTIMVPSTVEAYPEVLFRSVTGSASTGDCYALAFQPNAANIAFYKHVSSVQTSLNTAAFTFVANTVYNYEINFLDSAFDARIWTGARPASPTLTATDSVITTIGYVSLELDAGSAASAVTCFWDDFGFTPVVPEGSPAMTAPRANRFKAFGWGRPGLLAPGAAGSDQVPLIGSDCDAPVTAGVVASGVLGIAGDVSAPVTAGAVAAGSVGSSGAVSATTTVAPSWAETFTGTNGAGWDAAQWVTVQSTGGTTTIDGNRGKMVTSAAGSYTDAQSQRLHVAGNGFPDGMLSGTIMYPSVLDEAYGIAWFRASADLNTTGYFLSIEPDAGQLALYSNVAAVQTSIGTAAFTLTASTIYAWEIQYLGPSLQARIWDAAGSRPSTPTLTVTDTSVTTPGCVGLELSGGAAATAVTCFWDDFAFLPTLTAHALGVVGAVSAPVTAGATATGVVGKVGAVTSSVTAGAVAAAGDYVGAVSATATAGAVATGVVGKVGAVTATETATGTVVGAAAGTVSATTTATAAATGAVGRFGAVSATITATVLADAGAFVGAVTSSTTAGATATGVVGAVGAATSSTTAGSATAGVVGAVGTVTAPVAAGVTATGVVARFGAATSTITAGAVVSAGASAIATITAGATTTGATGVVGAVTSSTTAGAAAAGVVGAVGAVSAPVATGATVAGLVAAVGTVSATITAGASVSGLVGKVGAVTAAGTATGTVVGRVGAVGAVTSPVTAGAAVVGVVGVRGQVASSTTAGVLAVRLIIRAGRATGGAHASATATGKVPAMSGATSGGRAGATATGSSRPTTGATGATHPMPGAEGI